MGKLREIIESSNVRNVAKLLSANVVAQVIGLVVYPLLTRIYSPEDFGLLNLFLSIGVVLVIFGTAEYQYAIVLPKEEKKAAAIVHVGLILLLFTTIITAISVGWTKDIAELFNSPALGKYYKYLPVFVFVSGAWNLLNYWYIRQKMYPRISGYQMSQSALLAGTKLGFGYCKITEGGLIYSSIIAPLIAIAISIAIAWRKCITPLVQFNLKDTITRAKEYRNFPLFTLPRSLINVIANQLPILLLTPIFGTERIGLWSMSLLLGFVPINMLTKAFYQVLYQHTAERVHNHQSISATFRQFTRWCTVIIIPMFMGLYWILPDLSAWLLGEVWYDAGEYIRWMLPWLFCTLITASIGFLSDVFFQQKVGLYFEIALAVMRITGLAIGIYYNDFVVAIAAYSIGSAIAIASQWIWLTTLVRKYERSIVSSTNQRID